MKHIENFKSFNESWLGDKLKKWFPESKETKLSNEIASGLFNRLEETFNFTNLSNHILSENYYKESGFIYKLEETDSDLGYIEIKSLLIEEEAPSYTGQDEDSSTHKYINLFIDGDVINCNYYIKKNIYKYLKRKYKEKIESDKIDNLLKLKNRVL